MILLYCISVSYIFTCLLWDWESAGDVVTREVAAPRNFHKTSAV